MNVVFATSEVAPWSKSGGLADVSSALPIALAALGVRMTVVTPLYQGIDRAPMERIARGLGVPLGGDRMHADVWHLRSHGVDWLFLDPPGFFERPYLYGPPGGEYNDNAFRFAFLARGALEVALEQDLRPDVFHANDWHTGLLPLLLRRHLAHTPLGRARTIFTIHNLGYQGLFQPELIELLGLGADLRASHALELEGRLSYLKTGLAASDVLTTVSPTYAKEIQTHAFGHGLDDVMRARAEVLHGILNGIDTHAWDPAHDSHLPAHFHAHDLRGKRECKTALRAELGFPPQDIDARRTPLLAIVSRLAWQKGWDLLEPVADALLYDSPLEIVVLGSGEARYEAFFTSLQARHPERVRVRVGGFDEALSHRIEAGADMLLMPSHYEPCGLNQMYSLRYGTIPIVRATGGLEDTVHDLDDEPARGTGFKFREASADNLRAAVQRALRLYATEDPWTALMRRAMAADFSWDRAAQKYLALYAIGTSEPA